MSSSARSGRRTQPTTTGSLSTRRTSNVDRSRSQSQSQHASTTQALPRGSVHQVAPMSVVGIQGNAMTLPTPRPTSQGRRTSVPSGSSREGGSSVCLEACQKEKQLLMSREKQLQAEIDQLRKQLSQLTTVNGQKEQTIQTLTNENNALKSELEESRHSQKEQEESHQQEMEALRSELQNALDQLQTAEQDAKTREQQLQQEMADLVAAKDKEIAERELALEKLKMQMADSMKDGSWERQQKLAELGLELKSLRQECFTLRSQLKALAESKTKECKNCAESVKRAEKLAMTLKERDVTIGQLKTLCGKFETQLSQQDVLLKQWADSKGFNVKLP